VSFKLRGAHQSTITISREGECPLHRALDAVTVQAVSNTALRVSGLFEQKPVQFLLDSGAAVSVCRHDLLPEGLHLDTTLAISTVGANGTPLDVQGQVTTNVAIGPFRATQDFVVVAGLTVDCLLGADFLLRHGAVLNCKARTLQIGGCIIPLFPEVNKEPSMVCMEKTIEIPARSVMLLTAKVAVKPGMPITDLEGLLEPIGTPGMPKRLLIARSFSHVSNECDVTCQVVNVGPPA